MCLFKDRQTLSPQSIPDIKPNTYPLLQPPPSPLYTTPLKDQNIQTHLLTFFICAFKSNKVHLASQRIFSCTGTKQSIHDSVFLKRDHKASFFLHIPHTCFPQCLPHQQRRMYVHLVWPRSPPWGQRLDLTKKSFSGVCETCQTEIYF